MAYATPIRANTNPKKKIIKWFKCRGIYYTFWSFPPPPPIAHDLISPTILYATGSPRKYLDFRALKMHFKSFLSRFFIFPPFPSLSVFSQQSQFSVKNIKNLVNFTDNFARLLICIYTCGFPENKPGSGWIQTGSGSGLFFWIWGIKRTSDTKSVKTKKKAIKIQSQTHYMVFQYIPSFGLQSPGSGLAQKPDP